MCSAARRRHGGWASMDGIGQRRYRRYESYWVYESCWVYESYWRYESYWSYRRYERDTG